MDAATTAMTSQGREPSADELMELERELDSYLSFWACARELGGADVERRRGGPEGRG